MAGNISVSPVAPVTPVSPDISKFGAFVNQSASSAFATNVAVQDTNTLVNEATNTTASAPATPAASQGDNAALNESLTSLSPRTF